MDENSQRLLKQLLTEERTASLGTLRDGYPLVSLILFAASADFSELYIHASRLAQHTQDFLKDGRVGLMIQQPDVTVLDPQQLARLSLRGDLELIPQDMPGYAAAREVYLRKFPNAMVNFTLGDFSLYRIIIKNARFVAGFGKIFNLQPADFRAASQRTG